MLDKLSEEDVEKVLLFVDVLEINFSLNKFVNVFLHVFLSSALHWKQYLAGVLSESLAVLNWNHITFLEAFSDKVIHKSSLIGQMDVVVVFYALRNCSYLSSLVKFHQVNIGSTQQTYNILAFDLVTHFFEACDRKGSWRLTDQTHGVKCNNFLG